MYIIETCDTVSSVTMQWKRCGHIYCCITCEYYFHNYIILRVTLCIMFNVDNKSNQIILPISVCDIQN